MEQLKRYNYLISELEAVYHEASLRLGLSDSCINILYVICLQGDGCPLSDIIYLSGIRKQTINSALRKMEQEDLVYLKAAEGRKKRVYLTEKGRRLAENSAGRVMRMEDEIFASWTEEELTIYIELTARYLASMKEKVASLRLSDEGEAAGFRSE